MRFLQLSVMTGLIGGLLFVLSCASTPTDNSSSSDINDAAQDSAPAQETASADTSENDLNPDAAKPAVQAPDEAAPMTPPETAQAAPPPPPPAAAEASTDSLDTPPDASASAVSPPAQDKAAANPPPPAPDMSPPQPSVESSGPAAKVMALDFKANLNGGTVVLKTDKPVPYTTKKNAATNQYVIELKNTNIAKRFQRPYDTKEFSGPIASINGYQSGDSARIVVQLRENIMPSISQTGRVISIASQGGGASTESASANDQATGADSLADESATAPEPSGAQRDDAALQTSSVDDLTFGNNNKFYGRPISLELKDADVRDVFAFISEESGLNIVVGDDVTGKVTLKLRKIPWDQALIVLLQSKGLGYIRQGNILRISTLTSIQRESDQARTALEAKRLLEPLHVQVFPISYADVTQIDTQVKDFLSTRGKSKADKRTNNLVVTDIDENLVKIKALVKRLDTQTPQVLIEAKIIEASETFTKLAGVNWGFTGAQVDTGGTTSTGQQTLFTPSASTLAANQGFLTAGFQLGALDVFGNLSASLNLLETEGLAKVLSSPRIVTIDRQEATITQSQSIPYLTTTQSTGTTTGTSSTTTLTPVPQISFITVKLELVVKPQITVDGSVIMDIHLTREFADAVQNLGGNSSAPGKETREAKTQVLVENGDTIVIGGIYQSDTTDNETGIPWLRNIPLLGWLFKNDTINRSKNELVMFLTPRILNKEKAFGKGNDVGPAPTGMGRDIPAPVGKSDQPALPGKG